MKRTLLSIIIFCFLLSFKSKAEFELQELIPGFNYKTWFKEKTKCNPDTNWFGAWTITPNKNDIYFGFATARPAEYDGAILARLSANGLDSLGLINDQGVHGVQMVRDTLYIIGSDPTGKDGWDAGNFYKFIPPNNFIKIRYDSLKKPVLRNVIHSWGLFVDTLSETIYCSTGSYDPVRYSKNNNQCGNENDTTLACFGEIWKSEDKGSTWEIIAGKKPYDFCTNRVYDVMKFNGILYANIANYSTYSMKMSTNEGQTWFVIPDVVGASLYRMMIFKDKLLLVAFTGASIFTFDNVGTVKSLYTPSRFNYSFNVFANAEDRYLFTYFTDGSVYVTTDLVNWTNIIPATGKNFVSIAYRDFDKSLILSERGSKANLWKIDVSTLINAGVTTFNNDEDINFSVNGDELIIKNNIKSNSVNCTISNVLGQTAGTYSIDNLNNRFSIDISELTSGVYILNCRCGFKNYTFKFVKN